MHTALKIVAPALGAMAFAWIIWQSVRTGMPAGNPSINPRRKERPFQFWLVVTFFAVFAIWYGLEALRAI